MRRFPVIAATILYAWTVSSTAAPYCGELQNGYGPFDYRQKSRYAENLNLVERAHFTPDIEKLAAGLTGTLAADLDYTLRAFPNHHRALSSIAKLSLRDKTAKPRGAKWSLECYFNRAVRFAPDDGEVRRIYGAFLFQTGKLDDALEQLRTAVELDPDNGLAHYNLGITYLEIRKLDQAMVHAQKAEQLGITLSGLTQKIKLAQKK